MEYEIQSDLKIPITQFLNYFNEETQETHNSTNLFNIFDNRDINNLVIKQIGTHHNIEYRNKVSNDEFKISFGIGVAKWTHHGDDSNNNNNRVSFRRRNLYIPHNHCQSKCFLTITVGDLLKYYFKVNTISS